jgi:selenocysteine-specific elongation factor
MAVSAAAAPADVAAHPARTLNVNVGVLGHVDSGKTSLGMPSLSAQTQSDRELIEYARTTARVLSSVASTAAFDKNPQSRERGITLDLGFSSFLLPSVPASLRAYDAVQITLVDCPGHASLIRTIIGGAQIIDLMLLVVDVVKGIQTQTAEVCVCVCVCLT